jgi:hypothetical protein
MNDILQYRNLNLIQNAVANAVFQEVHRLLPCKRTDIELICRLYGIDVRFDVGASGCDCNGNRWNVKTDRKTSLVTSMTLG